MSFGGILNRRFLVGMGAVVAVFVVAIVGASSVSLTGADSAPGEGTTNAVCATALVVKTVVTTSGAENAISRVDVTGDMTQCVGEQILIRVEREENTPAWAVYNITDPISSLALELNSSTGAFFDSKPVALENVLQVTGVRIEPIPLTEFGVITLTIAGTWE